MSSGQFRPLTEVRMAIKEITEQQYDYALGVLPPALWLANRFLIGEPADHRHCKILKKIVPVYAAYFAAVGRFYEDPMSFAEFRKFDINDLPAPK
jgi:hypothetical protein